MLQALNTVSNKAYRPAKRADWLSRHGSLIAIHLILAYLLMRFVISDLGWWDLPAHFQAARFYRDHAFPWMHAWNPYELGGFPQGYGYPFLLHWLAGGLGRIIPIEIAFRVLIVLAIALLPVTIYLFLKAIQFSAPSARTGMLTSIGVLAGLGGPLPLGGTFFGVFVGGLAANAFAMPFYFGYLWALALGAKSNAHLIAAGALLGATVLSHPFAALMAGVAALGILVTHYRPLGTRALTRFALHGILGLLLSIVWWLPHLANRSFLGGWADNRYSLLGALTANPAAVVGTLAIVAAIVFVWPGGKLSFRSAVILFFVSLLFYLAIGLVENLPAFRRVPIHCYRLVPYVAVFAVLILVEFAEWLGWQPWLERFMLLATAALLLGSGNDWFSYRRRHVELLGWANPGGRGLVLTDHRSALGGKYSTPHLFFYDLIRRDVTLLNGLFVESSPLAIYSHSLVAWLSPTAWIWTAEPVSLGRLQPNSEWDQQRLKSLCRTLGVSWILSDKSLEVLGPLAHSARTFSARVDTERGSDRELYYFYEFGFPLVEFSQPAAVDESRPWRDIANEWWRHSRLDTVPVLEQQPLMSDNAAPSDDRVSYQSSSATSIELDIQSQRPRWVLLKMQYFPDWVAQQAGHSIPILRAAPEFMMIKAKGKVHLEFTRSTLVRACSWISAASWTLVTLLGVGFAFRVFVRRARASLGSNVVRSRRGE